MDQILERVLAAYVLGCQKVGFGEKEKATSTKREPPAGGHNNKGPLWLQFFSVVIIVWQVWRTVCSQWQVAQE